MLHAAGNELAPLAVAGEEVDAVGAADGAAGVLVEDEAAEFLPAADAHLFVERGLLALDPGQRALGEEARVAGDAAPGGEAGAEGAGGALPVHLEEDVAGVGDEGRRDALGILLQERLHSLERQLAGADQLVVEQVAADRLEGMAVLVGIAHEEAGAVLELHDPRALDVQEEDVDQAVDPDDLQAAAGQLALEVDLVAGKVGDEAVALDAAADGGDVAALLVKIKLRQVDADQVGGPPVQRVGISGRLSARSAQQRLVIAGEGHLGRGAGIEHVVLPQVAEEAVVEPQLGQLGAEIGQAGGHPRQGYRFAAEAHRRGRVQLGEFLQTEVDGVDQGLRRLVVAQPGRRNGRAQGVRGGPRGRRRRRRLHGRDGGLRRGRLRRNVDLPLRRAGGEEQGQRNGAGEEPGAI